MIIFVFVVILSSISATSMLPVPGSESTKTGVPPHWVTAPAVAIIVNAGIRTSSPSWIPSAHSARNSAEPPELTATACFAPQRLANASSNRCTGGAIDDSQFFSIASWTYFFSRSDSDGSQTLITQVLSVRDAGRFAQVRFEHQLDQLPELHPWIEPEILPRFR